AINDVGASDWSNRVAVVIPVPAPAVPMNLKTAVLSAGEIDLSWTSGRGGETGIAIFRKTGAGAWERIGVATPGSARYADRSVKPGMSYTYRIRSHNDTQVSAWTNEVSGVTPRAR